MRCSLLRPKWRTTGRVWVRHRRTPLGWITLSVSLAATQIGVGPKRPARSFRGSGPSPALNSGRPPLLPLRTGHQPRCGFSSLMSTPAPPTCTVSNVLIRCPPPDSHFHVHTTADAHMGLRAVSSQVLAIGPCFVTVRLYRCEESHDECGGRRGRTGFSARGVGVDCEDGVHVRLGAVSRGVWAQ